LKRSASVNYTNISILPPANLCFLFIAMMAAGVSSNSELGKVGSLSDHRMLTSSWPSFSDSPEIALKDKEADTN
jgi:hypothetical protein